MERRLRVPSTHTAPVSALAYQPVRREIITGHEGKQSASSISLLLSPACMCGEIFIHVCVLDWKVRACN